MTDYLAYIRQMLDQFQKLTARYITSEWRLLMHESDYDPFLQALREAKMLESDSPTEMGRIYGIPLCRTLDAVEIIEGQPEDIRGRILLIPPEHVERLGLE